ncbi:MAG: DNA-binding protein [Cytophagaceae bacterium]|nr:MAG: DNA-binding protein [Cytophagaceae bacterium]
MSSASEPLMTIAAVSAWLNVSPATVYRLCSSGKLPHSRVSNAIRIAPAVVSVYIESCGGP